MSITINAHCSDLSILLRIFLVLELCIVSEHDDNNTKFSCAITTIRRECFIFVLQLCDSIGCISVSFILDETAITTIDDFCMVTRLRSLQQVYVPCMRIRLQSTVTKHMICYLSNLIKYQPKNKNYNREK
jgi:hypothetical protein